MPITNPNMKSRSFGFTPARLMQMRKDAETREQEPKEFAKFPWFNPGEIELFEPQVGIYQFDIVQFKLDIPYHPYLAKTYKLYDLLSDTYWLDREVMIHHVFSGYVHSTVCKRSFGNTYNRLTKSFENDAMCQFLWDNKDDKNLSVNKFNKSYVIYLIRMHPNALVGNTDYKFMYFVATPGIFAKQLRAEMEAMEATNDLDNAGFYLWDKSGRTIKARFTEERKDLPTADGLRSCKWVSCSKIDFIERKDQLTDDDITFVENLHVDKCLKDYNEKECAEMVSILTGIKPDKEEEVVSSTKQAEKETFDPDKEIDKVFGEDTEDTTSSEDSIQW